MCKNKNIKKYDISDKEYPEKLKQINNPPKEIYVLGNLPDPNKKTVAIVGARNCSDYGHTIAKSISKTLSDNDIQIISGLALGIDTSGHIGAIESNKPTFAILGCGVNICYPTYNYNVYEKIIDLGGGIISELPENTPPLPYNFPLRNRIISALSDIVIIVEAKNKSGALITCEYAVEQGKDVFAVPGRVGDVLSTGTNTLIKNGAYILTSVEDIFERLCVVIDKKLEHSFDVEKLDYFEKLVLSALSYNAKHIDEIIVETKLPVEKCINTLMSLQLLNICECSRVNYYKLKQ